MSLDFDDLRTAQRDCQDRAVPPDVSEDASSTDSAHTGPVPTITVRPLRILQVDEDWVRFALDNGGSWRSERGHIRMTRLRLLLKGRLLAFEAFAEDDAGQRRKIAQCILSVRGRHIAFEDGLQIAAGYEAYRSAIVAQILPHLPAGRISYGWTWSLEATPCEDFRRVPGTSGHHCRDIIVHSVHLGDWPCWDSYYRAISNNVRRNVKRAEQSDPPVTGVRAKGLAAIRLIPDLVRMRQQTLDRVDMEHAAWRMALSYVMNFLTMPNACHIAVARQGGMPLAALFGYKFGSTFYYWQGGSIESSNGASWKLLTDTLAYWHRKHPKGQFIMGYFDDSLPGYRREGLHRQRESLRKSDYTTRLISFDWTPASR